MNGATCIDDDLDATLCLFFFLKRRSHSISFTRAQGIPQFKTGLGEFTHVLPTFCVLAVHFCGRPELKSGPGG